MEGDESMQWFRWWHDATTDGKLLRLSLEHRWVWIALLTLASESPKRGHLYVSENLPCDIEDVARKAYLDTNTCQAGIELMMRPRFNMVGLDENNAWYIVSWSKRQPKREDATNAERQKRYRNAHSNAQRNVPDTETDSETKTDTYKNTIGKKIDYDAEFEELWSIYPHPPRDEKLRAKTNYTSLRKSGETYEKLRTTVMRYEKERRGREREYHTKMANFFGRKGTWTVYAEDELSTAHPERQTKHFVPSDGFTFTDEPTH